MKKGTSLGRRRADGVEAVIGDVRWGGFEDPDAVLEVGREIDFVALSHGAVVRPHAIIGGRAHKIR